MKIFVIEHIFAIFVIPTFCSCSTVSTVFPSCAVVWKKTLSPLLDRYLFTIVYVMVLKLKTIQRKLTANLVKGNRNTLRSLAEIMTDKKQDKGVVHYRQSRWVWHLITNKITKCLIARASYRGCVDFDLDKSSHNWQKHLASAKCWLAWSGTGFQNLTNKMHNTLLVLK